MKLNPLHWIKLWREPWRKIFWSFFYTFRREDGEAKRWRLDLAPEDVVFDIGGFEGNWAADVHDRFGCWVHVFEPHPTFAAAISARFEGNPKIIVHDCALGSKDGVLSLSDSGDASSVMLANEENSVEGRVVDVATFMSDFEGDVSLVKINIEGGEYDLLPALAKAKAMARFKTLQVQFHLYTKDNIKDRDDIRADLANAHTCEWVYPFVWEQWSLSR